MNFKKWYVWLVLIFALIGVGHCLYVGIAYSLGYDSVLVNRNFEQVVSKSDIVDNSETVTDEEGKQDTLWGKLESVKEEVVGDLEMVEEDNSDISQVGFYKGKNYSVTLKGVEFVKESSGSISELIAKQNGENTDNPNTAFYGFHFEIENTGKTELSIITDRVKVYHDDKLCEWSFHAADAKYGNVMEEISSGRKFDFYYMVELPKNWETVDVEFGFVSIGDIGSIVTGKSASMTVENTTGM